MIRCRPESSGSEPGSIELPFFFERRSQADIVGATLVVAQRRGGGDQAQNRSHGTRERSGPTNLDSGGPDALFGGKENVIEGIFEKLREADAGLVAAG